MTMAPIGSPLLTSCLRQHYLIASAKPFATVVALAFGWNLLACGPVQSQEQPNSLDDVIELPEITVFGASRDGRGLLETPSAVTVIGGEDMDRLQPSTYEDLLIDVPGLVIQGGRGVAQEPNIRGFQDEQVVIRVDGARQNFNLQHRGRFFVDPALLKQVEVLRGGASAMFGSGALGGVISLETKDASDILKPGEAWGAEVNVGFNTQGSEALRAVTAALVQGNVDMLAFFSQRLMQADLQDGGYDPILDSAVDNLNGILKLTMTPNDSHKLSIDGSIYTDDGQVPSTANRDSTDERLRLNRLVDRDLNYQQYRFKWDYVPFDNEIVNLSALIYYNETFIEERRVSILPEEGESERRFETTEVSTVGVEITNSSNINFGDMPVNLAYGLEFFKDDHRATRNSEARINHPTAQRSFYAGFAQAEFSLSPEVTLSSGLRYDAFSLDPPDNFSRRSENALSPWLALNYQPSDHLQLFASVSQAFRAPTLTEIYAQGLHFSRPDIDPITGRPTLANVQVPDIDPITGRPRVDSMGRPVLVNVQRPDIDLTTGRPKVDSRGRPILINVQRPVMIHNTFEPNPDLQSEKATQIEIGTRYQRSNVAAAEDQLLLSANLYYYNVDNYIETFFPTFDDRDNDPFVKNTQSTATRNVDAVLYGLEAEISYDTQHWFTSANLTIPRGSEKDSSRQLVNIPQDRFSLTVGLKPNSQWEIGLRSTVAGERNVSDEDSGSGFADTESFLTLDLFANLRLGDDPSSGALVSFGIDNITNQKYKLHPNVLNSPGRSVKLNTQFTF